MKFSTAAIAISCLICAVRCGVILDKIKKVRCDLHHLGESIISHGHISDPCPQQQVTNADGAQYGKNQHEISTETSKHGPTTENFKHGLYQHGMTIEDNRQSNIEATSREDTKHDRYDLKGSSANAAPEKVLHETSTEAIKHKQLENNSRSHDTHQVQQSSSGSVTSKKNIDMDEIHAGAILFPGDSTDGSDSIHDIHLKTDVGKTSYDHSATTGVNVLATTTPANADDVGERHIAKVKPNCPVVDKNMNCIQDYS